MQKILILLGLIVLCACSLQPASSTETIITTPELSTLCEQKGYTWNADSTCTYEEGNEEYRIKIAYPIELLPSPLIETAIDSYIAEYRTNFMQQVADGNPTYPAAPWFFEMKYTLNRYSSTIVSLQIAELFFLGGPHHNSTLKSFTFDLAANQILAFEDLFVGGVDVLATIQPLARAELVEVMNAKLIPVDASDMMLLIGTDELNDFRNFAITETHLLISFETYQVAAYVAGQQDIQIPLSELEGNLKEL